MTGPSEAATLLSENDISMLRTLQIHLQEIGEKHAIMEVTVCELHRNYHGNAHGGLLATLIDTVAFFPQPLIPSGVTSITTNLNVTYLRPAAVGDRLTARAEVLHLGRRLGSVNVEVKNQHEKLVAQGTVTLMILAPEKEGATAEGDSQP